MNNYEIFDLLYSDIIQKFDADNRVFTHKCVVGKHLIRIHFLKPDEVINPVEILDFLNKLIFDYLSQNEEQLRMYQHFCDLVIS